MKTILLIVASILAVMGWFKPENTPIWMNVGAVIFILMALGIDIWLARQTEQENGKLKNQIAELHSEATRKPSFSLSLNDQDINERTQFRLTKNEGKYPFVLSLLNSGAQTANGVQVHILLPSQLQDLFLGKHWTKQGTPTVREEGGFQPLNGITQYSFISPVPIHQGDWLRLGHGYLPKPPNEINPMPLKVKVSVEGGEKATWVFTVQFC